MKQYYPVIKNCALFYGIREEHYNHIFSCLNIQLKQYLSQDYLFFLGDTVDSIGILLDGSLEIMKETLSGDRYIITTLHSSDLFGEGIVATRNRLSPVTVKTKTPCTVLWIPYNKLLHICNNACGFHTQLIHNMVTILGEKNYLLNHKIDLLVLKGIREKLANYLLYEAKKKNANSFSIPFNKNELAEYLNISRPSMSRELIKMKEEKIINYQKNNFEIINYKKLRDLVK